MGGMDAGSSAGRANLPFGGWGSVIFEGHEWMGGSRRMQEYV